MSDNDPFYRQMQLLNNSAETLKVRQTPFLHFQQYGNGMIQDNEASFNHINDPSPYVVPIYNVSNSEPFDTQEGLLHNNNAVFNAQAGNTRTILVNNDESSSNSCILSNEENGDPVKSSPSIPHEIVFPDGRVLTTHGKGPILVSNAPNTKKRSTPFQASASKIKTKHDIFNHPIFHIEIPSTSDAPDHRASKASASGRNRLNVNKRKSSGNVASTSNAQIKIFECVQPMAHTVLPSSSGIVTPGQGHLPPHYIENAFVKEKIRFKEIESEEERNSKGQSTNVEPTDAKKSNGLFDIDFSSFMDWLNSNDDELNDEQTIVNNQASNDRSALVTTDVQPVAISPLTTVSSFSTIPKLPDLGITSEELGRNLQSTNMLTIPLSSDCSENIVASRKRKLDVINDLNDEALESKRPNNNKENALFDDFTDFLDSDIASLKQKIEKIDSNDEDAEYKRMKTNSDDLKSVFDVDFTDLMDWIDSDNTSFQKMMDSDSSLE